MCEAYRAGETEVTIVTLETDRTLSRFDDVAADHVGRLIYSTQKMRHMGLLHQGGRAEPEKNGLVRIAVDFLRKLLKRLRGFWSMNGQPFIFEQDSAVFSRGRAGRVGLREKNKEDKLLRIREAAYKLFLSKGFDDTTTREIASLAGVGMGTVFVYAETKRDLLFLVVNDNLEHCVSIARETVRSDYSLLRNLLIILRHHYEYFAENPVISKATLREMYFYQSGKQAERFNRTRNALRHLITTLIADALENGAIKSDEPAELIAQAVFAIYQVDLRIWLSENDLDLDKAIDRVRRQIEIVLKGLSPKASALTLAD